MTADIAQMPVTDEVAVPGSVANLGGGFDTLAVAVRLYLCARILEVKNDGGGRLTVVRSRPTVSTKNLVEESFAAAARRWPGAPTVTVEVESEIPMASGLGSSAAAVVAGLRVFERVTEPFVEDALLTVATEVEGHADNVAAAVRGGLTSVVERAGDSPQLLSWRWPQELRLIVATPKVTLATSRAREALAPMIPREDAVFNLQRVLALVHAFENGDDEQLRESMRDRWHQPARAALVPQLEAVLGLADARVLGACLSGAGPSVAVLAREDVENVATLVRAVYERAGCSVTVRMLEAHQPTDWVPGAMASASGRAV
jgi:homoserine kinase